MRSVEVEFTFRRRGGWERLFIWRRANQAMCLETTLAIWRLEIRLVRVFSPWYIQFKLSR